MSKTVVHLPRSPPKPEVLVKSISTGAKQIDEESLLTPTFHTSWGKALHTSYSRSQIAKTALSSSCANPHHLQPTSYCNGTPPTSLLRGALLNPATQ